MYLSAHAKYLLFLSDFNGTWIFSTDFRITLNYKIIWIPIRWETSCSMRTKWRIDRYDEANILFSRFRERAQKFTCSLILTSKYGTLHFLSNFFLRFHRDSWCYNVLAWPGFICCSSTCSICNRLPGLWVIRASSTRFCLACITSR